jgi:hypothetical protein
MAWTNGSRVSYGPTSLTIYLKELGSGVYVIAKNFWIVSNSRNIGLFSIVQ